LYVRISSFVGLILKINSLFNVSVVIIPITQGVNKLIKQVFYLIIRFRTKVLEKNYLEHRQAQKAWGEKIARKYIQRINLIKGASSLEAVMKLPGLRCHPLKGGRAGQYAVNLDGFYRLIFTVDGDELEIALIEEVSKHYDD
jgi:proteic killer suppression protein